MLSIKPKHLWEEVFGMSTRSTDSAGFYSNTPLPSHSSKALGEMHSNATVRNSLAHLKACSRVLSCHVWYCAPGSFEALQHENHVKNYQCSCNYLSGSVKVRITN